MDVSACDRITKALILVAVATVITLFAGCAARTSAGNEYTRPQYASNSLPNDVKAAIPARVVKLGRVLLLKPIGDQSDVFERNLDTDSIKLLISHKSFPDTFVWPVVAVKPSPDGAYLALVESTDAFSGGGGRCWIWERTSGRISKISANQFGAQGFDWLSEGNRLLVHDDAGGVPWDGTYDGSIAVYDAVSRKLNKIGPVKGLNLAVSAGRGNDIIEVVLSKGDKSSVYLQPITGERRLLFHWPRLIISIAQSPDGSHFAFYDLENYYITDAHGLSIKKFKIPVVNENLSTTIKFSNDGKKVAVFTKYITGEPHVNNMQQLWIADVESGHARRIAQWEELFQGSDQAITRTLDGWLPDNKSIVISGVLYYGAEKPADAEHDWYRLWTYDTSQGKTKPIQLFDSGKGWYGAAWWH